MLSDSERDVLRYVRDHEPCDLETVADALPDPDGIGLAIIRSIALIDAGMLVIRRRKLLLTLDGRLTLDSSDST